MMSTILSQPIILEMKMDLLLTTQTKEKKILLGLTKED